MFFQISGSISSFTNFQKSLHFTSDIENYRQVSPLQLLQKFLEDAFTWIYENTSNRFSVLLNSDSENGVLVFVSIWVPWKLFINYWRKVNKSLMYIQTTRKLSTMLMTAYLSENSTDMVLEANCLISWNHMEPIVNNVSESTVTIQITST